MTQVTLPPVAKSFHTMCKKCGVERYHVVLAHKSATSAKIQCEVCKATSTFSLPKEGAAKKKTGVPRVKKATHSDIFQAQNLNRVAEKGTPFNIKTKFEKDQKIDHPKFGPGYVVNALGDRIEVMFESEVKTLMHNKT